MAVSVCQHLSYSASYTDTLGTSYGEARRAELTIDFSVRPTFGNKVYVRARLAQSLVASIAYQL